jgi:hypothetical protein
VRLLSEGVVYVPPVVTTQAPAVQAGAGGKGKGKVPVRPAQAQAHAVEDVERGIVPRGLINTGNMCFANTVSFNARARDASR